MSNFSTALYYSLKPKIMQKSFYIFTASILLIFILISIIGSLYYVKTQNEPNEEIGIITSNPVVITEINQIDTLGSFSIILVDSTETSDERPYVFDADNQSLYAQKEVEATEEVILKTISTNTQMLNLDLSLEQVKFVQSLGNYDYIYQGEDSIVSSSSLFYTVNAIVSIAAYMLIIIAIQFLGQEILDEKSSRAMEIIITSIEPKTHMFAKVVSNIIFIVLSAFVFLISSLIAGFIALKITDIDISIFIELVKEQFALASMSQFYIFIILSIVLLIVALVTILLVMAILSSIAANQDDYQKITMPVTIFILIPYVLAIIGIPDEVTKILGLIPVFNLFFVPSFYIIGELTRTYFIVSLAINCIVLFFILKYGSILYKEGVLNYSSISLKQIIVNAKNNYTYEKKLKKHK